MNIFNNLNDKKLIELINQGSIGLLPTDTVYGLVCSAKNRQSIDRIYKAKGREKKPGTFIASNIEQLESLGLKRRYLKAVAEYWPGPVSILIPCFNLVNNLDENTNYLAVRIPDTYELTQLLEKVGPLLTSSANKTGHIPVTNMAQAKKIFKDDLDFYVDGGDYSNKQASALIQIIDDAVEVIRPGYRFKRS